MEAKLLRERGYDVTCFAPSIRREKVFPDLMRGIPVKSYFIDFPFPVLRESFNMVAHSILGLISPHRFRSYDAIICHSQPGPWIGYNVHKRFGIPYMCYLQQPTRFLHQREIDLAVGWSYDLNMKMLDILVSKLGLPLVRKLDFLSITGASAVLTNSRWIAGWVRSVYHYDAIPCPLGIDPEMFKPLSDENQILSRKYGVIKPFLLTTCRNVPQKRIEWLIQIMDLILEDRPDVMLVVAGRHTSYTLKLKKLAKELGFEGNVRFIGEVHGRDLILLYSEAEVYVFPPPQEDFGLGPIEAMACGTPVVAWNYAGPSETIIHGKTGLMAKPYDLNDFAEKTLKILEDEAFRRRLGEDALNHVLKNYTWEKHMNMLEKNIKNVLTLKH